ncbi:MAG: urea carboxylase-associated family protein [Aphanocapsa lilacina HA4352-LM1]|nr:urea carboxylase-associated family protein [Aphanocapsa lilacina HA4352-LM1]
MVATADNGIDPGLVTWEETVPGGAYWSRRIKRATTLRIVDLEGGQGISLLCYNADNPIERYNAADTVKIQFGICLGVGKVLYSDMGRVLFSITGETTGGAFDTLGGASNPASSTQKYGEGDWRNTRSNFINALAKHDLGKKDIMPNLNLFARVAVEEDGGLTFQERSKAGSTVDLRAEMNVLVVISNTPHVLHPSPTYQPTPIRVVVWNSPPPAPGDPCRTGCPEAVRGFENTNALFV